MRFKLVILGLGVFLCYRGYEEMKLKGIAAPEAQEITCAELIANGPGENAHVIISDFMLLQQAYVYEGSENNMDKVWIPAVALGGEFHQEFSNYLSERDGEDINPDDLPKPKSIGLMVISSRMKTDDQMTAVADADTIRGLVINEIEKLSGEELEILKSSYPGIDFSTVYILEHGREPSGSGKMLGFLGGGALLSLLGLGLFLIKKD